MEPIALGSTICDATLVKPIIESELDELDETGSVDDLGELDESEPEADLGELIESKPGADPGELDECSLDQLRTKCCSAKPWNGSTKT